MENNNKIYTISLTFHKHYNVIAESKSVAIKMFVSHQVKQGRFNYDVYVKDGLLEKDRYELSNGDSYYVFENEVIE